ncbi:3-ketoacyl-CoA thiolase, mitochondrial isoform X2 [Bicyclus anynana]|uniref:3-ketoacyl-CoA thiolase, mitochondrial isoform X2 n=1 Tax=Bicyclus anynana TaxID=110368 RepID=A0ABM3LX48_BICAN|nr:3-ketoacyl-CoA thiolase, mitochondrial isoform X2 [Bicyclus anynana]
MTLRRKAIFVVGAKRTPFCKHGGYLRELPASYTFAAAAKDALNAAKLNSNLVDCTVVGNVNFEISVGPAKACLTGGTEIMSSLPFLVRNMRFGSALGVPYHFEDYIKHQVLDSFTGLSLQKMAEIVAEKYKITRQMADDFAYNSLLKRKSASSKILQDELTPLTAPFKKKEVFVDKDDVDSNPELNNFSNAPTLISDGTIVTSLNSSAPADGAAVLVLADEETIRSRGMTPLARVVAHAAVGADPYGLGTVAAVNKLMNDTGMSVDDVDLFEINETFATEVLATMKELKLDTQKVNVSGGALALGHPVAATGARMAVHLVHQLRHRNGKRAVAASSCGDGQGLAVMFESV